ncbi:MAG: phosphatidylglycerophosphatase A [Elusimicrobia bacterium]|nr:phosphatidylglycerophosphatase A [Elusimicrobiota bacterium]
MKIHPKITEFLATGFFISYIPARLTGFKKFTGAGLFGTALALGLAPFLPESGCGYGVFLAVFLFFSVKVAGAASALYGTHDDPRIVIDEILGYWVAVAFMEKTIFSLTFAFIFFRIIDTLKPWPIKRLEQNTAGGFGIILDDVAAGIGANILTRALVLFKGILGY